MLVRTTVKLVGSVETRSQERVFEPVEAQPSFSLGTVTRKAETLSAAARTERKVVACIVASVREY